MREQEPNWGLAFGSGSFLIVWCLGMVSHVPFEVSLGRATVAAVLGTLLGVVVGYTLTGLKTLRSGLDATNDKGARVDFTVGEDLDPLPSEKAMKDHGTDGSELSGGQVPAEQPFKPIDYKSSAKQVQSAAKE